MTTPAPEHSRAPRQDAEAGLLNIGFAAVMGVCTLALLVGFLWMAVASSAAQANQNAADAAALAGAEAFEAAGKIRFAPGFSSDHELRHIVSLPGGCPARVRSAAAEYASKNGASLETCRMNHWGEVEVTTRMEVPIDGAEDGRAGATANWSLDWASCQIDPTWVAPVTGAGFTWMQCGDARFDLKYAGNRYFLHPWGQVKTAIHREVRLVD